MTPLSRTSTLPTTERFSSTTRGRKRPRNRTAVAHARIPKVLSLNQKIYERSKILIPVQMFHLWEDHFHRVGRI